jgi:hypothetical protein
VIREEENGKFAGAITADIHSTTILIGLAKGINGRSSADETAANALPTPELRPRFELKPRAVLREAGGEDSSLWN